MRGKKKQAHRPVAGLWGKTPASLQRRQEIIAAAKTLFFEEGYQLASMEGLAAAAGTTKRTLYDHFGSKETLFAASIEYGCGLFVGALPRADDLPADTAKAVLLFIERMASLINAPDTVRFLRMVIAEAERHPDFGRILNEAAFAAAEQVLRDYLNRQVERGMLRPHDIASWAKVLVGLATNLTHTRALLAVREAGSETQAGRARAQIVAMYVRAHSVGGSGF